MDAAPLTLDEAGLQSLELLTAVTEQILGPRTMAVRELQRVMDERSFTAYWRASSAFNALSGGLRTRIADKATNLARQLHDPSADMRRDFPDLFGVVTPHGRSGTATTRLFH